MSANSAGFPLFAAVAAALGLGALGRYETVVLYLFQAFALLSLLGLALAFRQHRRDESSHMKMNIKKIGAALLTVGICAWCAEARAQETTTTVTTTKGAFTEFVPGSETVVVRTEANPAPLRYVVTKQTTIVDEAGAPVAVERISPGSPLSVQYTGTGDRLIASRIVVQRPLATAPVTTTTTAPVTTTVPVATEQRSSTTTTRTRKEALEERREDRKERAEEQIEKQKDALEKAKDKLEDDDDGD